MPTLTIGARDLQRRRVIVYSIELPESYLFSRETFAQQEHAERFLAELRRLDPELPSFVRIEKQVLDAGRGLDACRTAK
jgi:hypothetical protein